MFIFCEIKVKGPSLRWKKNSDTETEIIYFSIANQKGDKAIYLLEI